MGRKEEVCGAVTGGVLVLGLRHGRGNKDERSATDLTYMKTRKLIDDFAARQGSCICRQLLNGCELTTEAGQQEFKKNDMLNRVCKVCVETVVDILEKMK
jgi:C_GCAxxG_C_C family probable redox protein